MRACSGVWVAHGSGSADRETVDIKDRIRGAAGRGAPTCCGASGSPRRRRRATTTASPTRACGRSATSPTRARCSAPRTGSTTCGQPQVRRRGVRGGRSRRPDRAGAGLPLRLAPRMIRERCRAPRSSCSGTSRGRTPSASASARGARSCSRACSARASSASTPSSTATTSSTRSTASWRPHRSRGERGGAGRPQHAGAAVSDLDRVAGALARGRAADRTSARVDVRRELGLAPDALLGVGVDRLDYTKGIEERLLAVERAAARATRSSAAGSPSCSWPRPAAPRSSATAS